MRGRGRGAAAATSPAEVRLLCSFGQRLIDLDAEDFGVPERTGDPRWSTRYRVPEHLLARARASRMPQSAKERSRGALRTLRPAYGLLLEVIEARWLRREMAALVAAVHIAAEYLPLLAWEPVLGHAGDPGAAARLDVGPGSRFGVTGGQTRPRDCALTRPAAVRRRTRAARGARARARLAQLPRPPAQHARLGAVHVRGVVPHAVRRHHPPGARRVRPR